MVDLLQALQFLQNPKKEEPEEKMQSNKSKQPSNKVFLLIKLEGGIFCLCRRPYENELDMI